MKQAIGRFAWMLAGALVLGSLPARAGDLLPPCWRGQPGSTYQLWNFNSNANPAGPNSVSNPHGMPATTIAASPGGAGWINTLFFFGTNQGVWDLGSGGTMTVSVPNPPASSAWKYVSVQVQQILSSGSAYSNLAAVNISGATLVSSQLQTNNTTGGFFVSAWVVAQTLWRLDPDPGGPANVVITGAVGATAIDQVIVDTLVTAGDDGDPFAPCWRNTPGTTFQSWSFHTPASTALAPEQGNNLLLPAATVTPGLGGLGWYDFESGVGCQQGFWDMGSFGTIEATIPGAAGASSSYKYVQVQVMRFSDGFIYAGAPVTSVTAGSATVTPMGGVTSLPWTGGAFGQWFIDRTVWRVAPDAGVVTVTVTSPSAGALVNQVVVDTVMLDPSCPDNQVLAADAGICGRSGVTWTLPAPDGCIITNIVSAPANGSFFNVGTTLVTNRFQDSLGGEKLCTFTVTVLDNQPPVVTCPADIVVTNNPSLCGAVVTFSASATDNCSVTNIAYSHAPGSTFPLGVTTVTCVATDASGNASTPCSFTVRVMDVSGDVLAPCWRGTPGSTFQQWVFTTDDDSPLPELVGNAGSPAALVTLGHDGLGWYDLESGVGCRQGFWDLGAGGAVECTVPGPTGSTTSYQYVRAQVVFLTSGLIYPEPPENTLTAGAASVTQVGEPEYSILSSSFAGIWVVQKTVWKISPGTTGSAMFTVQAPAGGALVDQVIVDTLLVEPADCPEDIVAVADPGQCGRANVTWSAPALPPVDGCLIKFAGDSPPSGSTFAVGTQLVTRTIVDAENQTNVCTFTVTINDVESPVISVVAATQVQPYVIIPVDVKDCAQSAVQGIVNIAVTATDACPLSPPMVGLTNGPTGVAAAFVGQSGNVFNYTWPVTSATADGTWTVTVAAADSANVTTDTFTVCVNTRQISGQVELQGFVGTGTVPPHARAVTFVATEVTPSVTNVLQSWTVTLTNLSGAVFNYTLADVPAGTTQLSAKTAWNLRRKVPVNFSGANGTAGFTGGALLLGGDLDGSNKADAVDYGIVRVNYGGAAGEADIDGSGGIDALDLGFVRANYDQTGDTP